MLKWKTFDIVFQEVPNETTIAFNLTNCPVKCPDCHSKELWEDKGFPLDGYLPALLSFYDGITCVGLMGGDSEPKEVNRWAKFIKDKFRLKVAWYSGRDSISKDVDITNFDFIKIGPFISDKGGLDSPNTNQIFYEVVHSGDSSELVDITYKFH